MTNQTNMTEANQRGEPMDCSSGSSHCCVRQPLTFGSLFAGIGGIDLGFERAGLQCKWQVEIDEYARKVLAKHWPEVRRHDDVKTWPENDTERVDVIAGGFPCQDISYAGKGAGLEGERSGLFYEVARIIRIMEPRIVVLENVSALLTRGMGDVLGTLASLGYDAEWECLPASAFGAPHRRDRVFIVSYAKGERCGARWARRVIGTSAWQEDETNVADAADAIRRPNSSQARTSRSEQTIESRRDGSDYKPRGDWWSVEPELGRVAHGVPRRVDRLRGLGNAVVPQVAEWIGRRIIEAENHVT
jgi:DNA (cytosine-5)-methyltransferase 1